MSMKSTNEEIQSCNMISALSRSVDSMEGKRESKKGGNRKEGGSGERM